MYLYQEITKVPGLTGSSYDRQKQYYEKLGSPQGPYSGTAQQNSWLISQISKPNFGLTATKTTPKATQTPLANQVASMYPGPTQKTFREVLPYDKAWGSLLPTVQQEATATINPFVQRELQGNMRNFYANLANTGGWRSGRAVGGQGDIWAQSEANRKAQIIDWINQREQGFQGTFYNPAEIDWTTGMELGQKQVAPKTPTWDELQKQLNFNAPKLTMPGITKPVFNY